MMPTSRKKEALHMLYTLFSIVVLGGAVCLNR